VGIVFIVAGVRNRRGPHRVYIRFARRLCQAGYPVLRYDPPGIGDSPGELNTVIAHKKQVLDCTESVTAAIDCLQTATDVKRVCLIGLFGGPYSGLVAGVAEPRGKFTVLVSLPVQELGDLSESTALDATIDSYFLQGPRLAELVQVFHGPKPLCLGIPRGCSRTHWQIPSPQARQTALGSVPTSTAKGLAQRVGPGG